ncbi:MAG: hypothetical protein JSS99_10605 [Actinobacteria bacterium]|nr:hypothetical protein [Actinomycetota bacterium]
MSGSWGARASRLLTLLLLLAAAGAPVALAAADTVLVGTPGNDVIVGGSADEAIYGGAGNDTLSGGAGNDELDGGPGADILNGGPGSDVVSYSGTLPVKVTLDGVANDGTAGEGDNVGSDVEDIFGGDGDDKLVGSRAANTIDGGAGDDTIDGGAGSDRIYGGAGNDTIDARDGGPDRVDCGPGVDEAIVDAVDVVVGCEHQALPPSTPPMRLSKLFPQDGRIGSLLLAGVLQGSRVVVACRTQCRPAGSPRRAIVRLRHAHPRDGAIRLALPHAPGLVAGTTFEIGVAAPRASIRCSVYRLSVPLRTVATVRTACTTVAASR